MSDGQDGAVAQGWVWERTQGSFRREALLPCWESPGMTLISELQPRSLSPGSLQSTGGSLWEGPGEQQEATEWPAASGQGCLSLAPPSLPLQDVLCTPTHRLLQDSQDVPVTVTPLRAERVLLFDDALVLLQVGAGLTPVGCWGLVVEKGLGKGQAAETEDMDLGSGEGMERPTAEERALDQSHR